MDDNENVSDTIRWLAQGPYPHMQKYSGYRINDFQFLTRKRNEIE